MQPKQGAPGKTTISKGTAAKARRPPVRYSEAVGREICNRLANGESLRSICRDERMPDEKAVRKWAKEPKHPFGPHYARARELGYECLADEILDIADDGTNDWMERRGAVVLNKEAIDRSKLRVEARKWMLSKMLPKVYGDKVEATHKHDASQAFITMLKAVSAGAKQE